MTFPSVKHVLFTLAVLVLGAASGIGFAWIGTPLPFMLGSLVSSAILAMAFGARFPVGYDFPIRFRALFIGVIGVMIGAQVSPALLGLLPTMVVSIPAILLFVGVAHWGNFQIFHRFGGLDRPTAYYSGSPGGLMEAIAFGEEDGADIRMLTILQFLRIIVVVAILPLAISIYEGAPVGSAAGLRGSDQVAGVSDVVLVLAFSIIGLWVGTMTKVPAAQLTGPLLLVGALSAFGLVDVTIPPWLVATAQVVLGAGLGLRFVGLTRRMIVSGLGLAAVSVTYMFALGALASVAISKVSGFDIETLIISFAPGGVSEMSLIALSLAANPAFVTLHHLVRILGTVLELAIVRKAGWL